MLTKPIVILLVEDNQDHVLLTKQALEDQGLTNRIYVAEDGQEALDYLYRRGEYSSHAEAPRPGLILLDIRLPKIDGLEVLRVVKSDPELKTIPVVMLTTSTQEEEVLRSYQDGANSYITKPVNFAEFVERVQALKLYWLLVNRLPEY